MNSSNSNLCVISEEQQQEYLPEFTRLKQDGIDFVFEHSGMSALEQVKQIDPRIIVLGTEVGDFEGIELLALIMNKYKDFDRPIIVLPEKEDGIGPILHSRAEAEGRSMVESIDFEEIAKLAVTMGAEEKSQKEDKAQPPKKAPPKKQIPAGTQLGMPAFDPKDLPKELQKKSTEKVDAAFIPEPPVGVPPVAEPPPPVEKMESPTVPSNEPGVVGSAALPQEEIPPLLDKESDEPAPRTTEDLIVTVSEVPLTEPKRSKKTVYYIAAAIVAILLLVGGFTLLGGGSDDQQAVKQKPLSDSTVETAGLAAPQVPEPESAETEDESQGDNNEQPAAPSEQAEQAEEPAPVESEEAVAPPEQAEQEEEPAPAESEEAAALPPQEPAKSALEGPAPGEEFMLPLYFEGGKIRPVITNVKKMSRMVAQLKNSNTTIELIGHASIEGSESNNQLLGEQRAARAKTLLVSRGVPSDQIEITSHGSSRPIASNETERGRKRNRRISVRLIENE